MRGRGVKIRGRGVKMRCEGERPECAGQSVQERGVGRGRRWTALTWTTRKECMEEFTAKTRAKMTTVAISQTASIVRASEEPRSAARTRANKEGDEKAVSRSRGLGEEEARRRR